VPRVILEGVTKVFEAPGRAPVRAVSDLNLHVDEGECLVLVGPSGSGKTTALRLIAGLESPTSGTIRIGPKIVNDIPPKTRDVAMVFQSPALYPHLSAYDNMALGLKLRKFPPAEVQHRVRTAAQMLELTDYLSSRPMDLSGGQRQRVAIGRAVVRQAAVVLFDEPLMNVEPGLRARLRRDIAALKESPACMIYVTHDHLDALTLGNRVAVLRQGVLQQIAEPAILYETPANLFVAGFLGSPAMNFFEGTTCQSGITLAFEPAHAVADSPSSTPMPALTLRLLPAMAQQLQSAAGKPLVLGLRPEHLQIVDGHQPSPSHWLINARVVFVERAGADQFVHARCSSGPFIARVPSSIPIQVNQDCVFSLDPTRAYFFDAISGLALL
jgi:multiple sugar transport system ATP-binding protein